jgi:hypothetical protein
MDRVSDTREARREEGVVQATIVTAAFRVVVMGC